VFFSSRKCSIGREKDCRKEGRKESRKEGKKEGRKEGQPFLHYFILPSLLFCPTLSFCRE
jgi:hypothetical protein